MGTRTKLIATIIPLLLVAAQTSANKCNCDGYFCVNDKAYQLCRNGEVAGDPVPCDDGILCRNETCSRQPLCQERQNEESNVANPCQSRGQYPDPKNCQRFYFCTGYGVGHLMSCPTGTYFDESSFFCSRNVPERCGSTPVEDERTFACRHIGLFPDPLNCRRYYQCYGTGNPVLRDCADGTYFDETIEECVPSIPERCRGAETEPPNIDDNATETTQTDITGTSTVYPEDDVQSTAQTTDDGELTQQTTDNEMDNTNGTTTSTSSPPKHDGFVCPGVGYYPDPESCQRYYVCDVVDRPMRVTCPNGTYYDEEFVFCTNYMPERCRGDDTSTTERVTTRLPDESEDQTTVGTTTSTSKFLCSSAGVFPDPENCQRYYICISLGVFYLLDCPNDTYYDAESTYCSNEIPERCREPSDNVSPTSTAQPTTIETETTEMEITTPTAGNGFECPGEGYFPDPNNCNGYIVCYKTGDSYLTLSVNCPWNTYFDERSEFCIAELPERCSDQSGGSTTKSPQEEFTCPGTGYYPDPKNCSVFYQCSAGVAFPFICARDTYFNDENNSCTEEIPQRCRASDDDAYQTTPSYTERPTTDEDNDGFSCPGEGYYPDPENCQNYYVCYNLGAPIPVSCPDNTYFDEESSFCTDEMPVRCRVTGRPGNEDTPTTPSAPKEGFTCPGEGYYPDPEDCQYYYFCRIGNRSIRVSCPDKTFYDELSTFCSPVMPARCLTTERPNQTEDEFVCPDVGLFPHPEDCHRYYECHASGHAIMRSCNASYFSEHGFCSWRRPERCASEKPDTENEFTCPHSGLFPYLRNCSRYHVCNWWGGYEGVKECPHGMYFDEKIKNCSSHVPLRCDWPWLEHQGYLCSNRGYFADPFNCSMYHVCNTFGYYYNLSCPTNTYYHEDTQTCSRKIPNRCIYLGQVFAENIFESRREDVLSDNGNPLNNTFVCPYEGLFPDPHNCHKFYVCYGQPRHVTCWGKTYYSEETQQCEKDMPERCKDVAVPQPPNIPPITPQPEEFVCSDGGLFPDPLDCRRFYVCYGKPRRVTCRGETYYDDKTQKCVEDMPERCKSNGDVNVTTPSPTPPVQPGDFVCPNKGLFAHPTDCHKFYVCYGEPEEITCYGHTYYDEEGQYCVEDMPERCKSNGDENVTPPPTPRSTMSQPGEFMCPGNGTFADPEDCRKFYICYGEQHHFTCPNGTYFHENISKCREGMPDTCGPDVDQSTATTTTEAPTTQGDIFQCRNRGRYPDPLDCQAFYFCNWRLEAFHINCRDSNYFNDITRKCEPYVPGRCKTGDDRDETTTPSSPAEFVCTDDGRFPDPEDCLSYYYCSDEGAAPIRYTCPPNKFFNADKGKCRKIKTGEECQAGNADRNHSDDGDDRDDEEEFQCNQPGRYPDLRDCKKFYECSFSLKMKHKTCRDGKYFNETYRRCSFFRTDRCRDD